MHALPSRALLLTQIPWHQPRLTCHSDYAVNTSCVTFLCYLFHVFSRVSVTPPLTCFFICYLFHAFSHISVTPPRITPHLHKTKKVRMPGLYQASHYIITIYTYYILQIKQKAHAFRPPILFTAISSVENLLQFV